MSRMRKAWRVPRDGGMLHVLAPDATVSQDANPDHESGRYCQDTRHRQCAQVAPG